MTVTPDVLDRYLDEPCGQCQRPFRWCECGLPPYITRDALRGDVASVIRLLDRWQAEDAAACPPGKVTIMRLWGATRRARGWDE